MADRKTADQPERPAVERAAPAAAPERTVGIRDERETERPLGMPAPHEPEVAVRFDGAEAEVPGMANAERAAALEEAGKDATKDIKPGIVYRVHGSSARVEHADGHSSYHAAGTLLRFDKKPKAFEGQLVEEVSAKDARDLESHGLTGTRLPNRPKDDEVEVIPHFSLTTARTTAAIKADKG